MLFVIMWAILIVILFLCISDFVLAPLLKGLAKPKASRLRTQEQRKSNTTSIPIRHKSSGAIEAIETVFGEEPPRTEGRRTDSNRLNDLLRFAGPGMHVYENLWCS